MIGLPQRRSMSLALAFIAMSIAPCVAPARNVATDKVSSDRAKPRAARAAAKPKPAMTDAGPLRKRWAKRPMSGIAMIAPAAKARSATLSVASESARSALDPGDSGCPAANSDAIRHEGAERRQAPRPGRRHNPVRGKLETRVGHLGLSGMHERTAKTVGVGAAAKRLQQAARGERSFRARRTRVRQAPARPLRGPRSQGFRPGRWRTERRFQAFR